MQLNKEKKKEIPLNDDEKQRVEEQELARKRVILLIKVLEARLKVNDHSKSMMKMVEYAKCVTVRDL